MTDETVIYVLHVLATQVCAAVLVRAPWLVTWNRDLWPTWAEVTPHAHRLRGRIAGLVLIAAVLDRCAWTALG